MIKRDYNADFINSVINHPEVKDGAEVKGVGDASLLAANLNNFVLVTEFGGFIVIKKMAGLYECHTQFLPEGRGAHAVEAVREALRYMFTLTDCERIVTKVHVDNRHTQIFTAQFFKKRGRTGDHFYYSMDIDDWVITDSECQKAGDEFHALLGEHKDHDDDKTHDCFAGYAWLTAKTGNVFKAQMHYNKWAVMAGYEPLLILSERPLVILVGQLRLAIDQEGITCL